MSSGLEFGKVTLWHTHTHTHTHTQSITFRLGDGAKVPVQNKWAQNETRATSLGRGAADGDNEYSVASATNESSPSSPTTITWDGKFSSRVSPGGTRASVPSVRSESAGGAVRSPGKNLGTRRRGRGSYVRSTVLRSYSWGPDCKP